MARRYTSTINFRAEAIQLARVNWLADYLEIGQGDLLRSMVDGVRSIDGVDLVRSLARLSHADPANYDQIELVYDDTIVGRAKRDAAHA